VNSIESPTAFKVCGNGFLDRPFSWSHDQALSSKVVYGQQGNLKKSEVLSEGRVPVGQGGYKKRGSEGEYGGNILCICMKMEK
jgi:hypothetical protein